MDDKKRAGLISLAQAVFPVLELSGVVHVTSDQVAAFMLLISQALTVLMLFWKSGQEAAAPKG